MENIVPAESQSTEETKGGEEVVAQEPYTLSKKERRQEKRKQNQEERHSKERKRGLHKILKVAGGITVIVVGVGALIVSGGNSPHLPPTSMQNHIESSPTAHILTSAMPENIQKHMLEHADGEDTPGIIIQYNCEDYTCEADLVEKLSNLVNEYPENVYLAPNNYDGKIILTKLNARKILEDFDEEVIRNFIR